MQVSQAECFCCTKKTIGWSVAELNFISGLKNLCIQHKQKIQQRLSALDAAEPKEREME